MKTVLKAIDKIYSKGFAAYSVVVLLCLVVGMMLPMTVQTMSSFFLTDSLLDEKLSTGIKLDTPLVEATIKNFDGVSNELLETKVNELTDTQLSYILRSGYTIYVIKNFDHLGSEAALTAQTNGNSVFVEESNKTIWCYESAPEGEFSQLVDQFIEDQRLDIQTQ